MGLFFNPLIPVIKPLFLEIVIIQAYAATPTDNETPTIPLVLHGPM